MINDKNEIVEVVNQNNSLLSRFFGEGGKGGGGSAGAVEATDTLRNNSFVNALELLSEGQINGLHRADPTQTDRDGQSVFINGTPLQNVADASFNFQGAPVPVVRLGSLDQTYIPGFESVTNTVSDGRSVLHSNILGVIYHVSSSAMDSVRITLMFLNGLKTQDRTNGNINGGSVNYRISKKVSSAGNWELVVDDIKTGKSNSPYSWQIYIPRAGTGVNWDIKVERISDDAPTDNIVDLLILSNIVEIQEVQLAYPGFAYVGLQLDAQQFRSQIPVRSYLVDGVNIATPVNYSTSTHLFTGMWDGTFETRFSDDPAWVLYDLLTNTVYGAGLYGILPAQIDKWSFYNASVFNNALVSNGDGGTERRFTFNALIAARSDMLTLLLNVAGMMNATLVYVNGLITLVQDRPTEASVVVNKSNVINGLFTYKSTPLNTFTTAANITYTDKNNNYLPVVTNISADATASTGWMGGLDGLDAYGYNPTNIAAYGATTEGQAQRAARWYIYTNLHQNEVVEFSMGLEGFRLNINDVISLFDEDYAAKSGAGRVVSATSTTITFDRLLVIDGSAPSVSVVLPDGVTYETHDITGGSGYTVSIANAGTTLNQQTGATGVATSGWTVTPTTDCLYNVTSAVAPRTFRITDIKQNTANASQVDVVGVLYDKNNYTAIETGVSIPAGVYTLPQYLILSAPQTITFTDASYHNVSDGIIKRSIIVSWVKPTTGTADHYVLKYRRDNNNFTTVDNLQQTTYEILDAIEGSYDINIFAVNANQLMSLPATATHVISLTAGTGSTLNPVTSLALVTGGTAFSILDLNVQWTNPLTNDNTNGVLKEFQADVYNGAVKLRSEFVAAVLPGSPQTYSYTYNMNVADGGPLRTPTISVFCVDTMNLTSTATNVTFTNATPAAPSGIVVSGGVGQVFVSYAFPTDTDYKGTLIWMSLTSGFTPSAANLVYDGSDNSTALKSLGTGVHYVKIAHYDNFGKSAAGTGMNLSAQSSTTPTSSMQVGTAYLYQWSTTSPATGPSGNTTWTWATGINSAYTGAGGWSITVPANPGTSGVLLWVASKAVTDYIGASTTTLAWTGASYVAWAGNGAGTPGTPGANGLQVANPTVYKWASSIPSGPSGTPTYTWSTGLFGAAPSGWTLTPGTSPSAGYTLWGATVNIIDSSASTTTVFNWSSVSITARGYAGTNGSPGSPGGTGDQGASAEVAYTVVASASSPSGTPSPYTIAGRVVPAYSTWGMGETWTWTVPSYTAGQTVYQTMGVYDPATGNSVYEVPFISSLKVGSLSAITVNTGALTVNGTLTMATTGQIRGGQTAYGTGTGFFLGYSGGKYKFSLGTGLTGLTWDGTTLSVPAASITGTLTAAHINANGLSIYSAGGTLILNAGASIQSQIAPYTSGATVNQSDTTTNAAISAAQGAANTANSGLTFKLANNARNVLAGYGGLATGGLTWNSSGVYTGGNGIGITANGIVAYNSGLPTFVLDGPTGNASFAGQLNAATGSFSGSLTADAIDAVDTINIRGNAVSYVGYGAVTSLSVAVHGPSSLYINAKATIETDNNAGMNLYVDGVEIDYSVVGGGGLNAFSVMCSSVYRPSSSGTVTISIAPFGIYSQFVYPTISVIEVMK